MYLFDNELFAIECMAKYAMEGLVVKYRGIHNGRRDEFAHCPTPRPKGQKIRLPGDLGYYLTFFDHQHQGLLQSVDAGRKCYISYKVKLYLDTKPPGYEELNVIYKKFNARTKESRIKQSITCRGRTGALHPRSKAIIVIKPDGTELHFGSIDEAARELKLPGSHLSGRYLKPGKQPKQGKCKGYQFFYAVKK